jgi:hypothetical protein
MIFHQQPPVIREPSIQVLSKLQTEFGTESRARIAQPIPNSLSRIRDLLWSSMLVFHCLQSFFQAIFGHCRPPVSVGIGEPAVKVLGLTGD